MTHVPHVYPCNELDVFRAVKTGNWQPIADNMAAVAQQMLTAQKKSPFMSGARMSHRDREVKARSLLLPAYPLVGIFQMQHHEGSSQLLAALKSNDRIKRLDCSQLVMRLIKSDPDGLIWGLKQGWDAHLGLLASRQIEMKWDDVRMAFNTRDAYNTLDDWMRKWSKRNPHILKELVAPTMDDCRTLLVDHVYCSPKELIVLCRDEKFQGLVRALESLSFGTYAGSYPFSKDKVMLLRNYFTQEPVVQAALPENFDLES